MPKTMTKVTLSVPVDAAKKLIDGFKNNDPRLQPLIEEFKVLGISLSDASDKRIGTVSVGGRVLCSYCFNEVGTGHKVWCK